MCLVHTSCQVRVFLWTVSRQNRSELRYETLFFPFTSGGFGSGPCWILKVKLKILCDRTSLEPLPALELVYVEISDNVEHKVSLASSLEFVDVFESLCVDFWEPGEWNPMLCFHWSGLGFFLWFHSFYVIALPFLAIVFKWQEKYLWARMVTVWLCHRASSPFREWRWIQPLELCFPRALFADMTWKKKQMKEKFLSKPWISSWVTSASLWNIVGWSA